MASNIRWGDWGERKREVRGRDKGASTEELEAGRQRVTLTEITSTKERARPAVA